ncbi:MAG: transcription antitermination factor NusB [Actinomycetota bacterium]|jgi:N utilization substance protein B
MSARSKARKRALDILYESDMRALEPRDVLSTQTDRRAAQGEPELNAYVSELVDGVIAHQARIDELLSTYSMGWSLERMPAVDRAILRLSAYEVLYRDDIPDTVAISEAVALAQDLSTEESSSFVNGLLARLSEVKPRLGIVPVGLTD